MVKQIRFKGPFRIYIVNAENGTSELVETVKTDNPKEATHRAHSWNDIFRRREATVVIKVLDSKDQQSYMCHDSNRQKIQGTQRIATGLL